MIRKAVITPKQDNVPIFHGLGPYSGEQKVKRQFHSRIKLDRYQNIVVAKFIMLPSFNVFRIRAAFSHLWESLKSNWNDGIF